jgi:predicted amidohydrolase YtcJ
MKQIGNVPGGPFGLCVALAVCVAATAGGCEGGAADEPLGRQAAALDEGPGDRKGCTLFYHGKVFTADPSRPWAQALVVCGERILSVGSDAELTPALRWLPGVDLGGRTVVPGLNDAHVHVLTVPGLPLNVPDFVPGPGPTLSEVVELVRAGAEQNPPGTWLQVTVGEAVLEDPNASRFALDPVSPDHPVLLRSWAGHGTYINTRAMAALGIAETEPDPFGGRYGRVAGSNVLTGAVHEYAEHLLSRRLFETASDAELAHAYEAFSRQAAQLGFTTIQDMALGLPQARTLRVLSQADLALRVRSICFPLSPEEACVGAPPDLGGLVPWVRASGFKWITDGSPIERGAFLEEPYFDEPATRGGFNFASGALQDMLRRGLNGPPRGAQALIHTVGDGAVDNVLAAVAATGGAPAWNGRRLRIEHADLLFPEHFGELIDLGAVVVQNPLHLGVPELLGRRFGPERIARAQPLQTLRGLGIPLALGTDAIGAVSSPWLDVFLAAIHPTRPSEAITVEQAVSAYTYGSAYAEFEEYRKGRLAPGKLADLAVLSQDVFTAPLPTLPATHSVLTVVGGRIVWDSGEL